MSELLRAEHVASSRDFRAGASSSVDDVSLTIDAGALTVLCGAEGCGKNLLLRLLGLLEIPETGEIFLHGAATRSLDAHGRMELRNRHFGFLFAEPFLLGTFSVLENVAMPLFKISNASLGEARAQTAQMLELVGCAGLGEHRVEALPLLAQHRVALARALVNRPEILLVENAGAQLGGSMLADFMQSVNKAKTSLGLTVILTTDDAGRTPEADRIVEFAEGRIRGDFRQPQSPAA